MLDKIKIANFQSHQNSELILDPGVNVITGSSDAGKTSILRSLLWLFNNRPSGSSIENWYMGEADKVSVSVTMQNITISKERKNDKTAYFIKDVRQRVPTKLEAVRKDVPDEVSSIANISDYNIQTQHQPYFLLNETPGEVARRLNELVGLDIIDILFRNLNSKISSLSSLVKSKESQSKELEESIKELSYVESLDLELSQLERLILENEELIQKSLALSKSITAVKTIDESIQDLRTPFDAEKDIAELLDDVYSFQKEKEIASNLNVIISKLNTITDDIEEEKTWLECNLPYTEIQELIEERKEFITKENLLTNFIYRIKSTNNSLEDAQRSIGNLSTDYMSKIKKSKICPLCFSPITEGVITEIEGSL